MTSRRDFLRTSSLALSALGLASLPGVSRALGSRGPVRMTISESFVFPEWLSAMASVASQRPHSADRAFWDAWQLGNGTATSADERSLSVVTLPAPGVEPFAPSQARELAIAANDQLALKVRSTPGLAGLATVSAFDPFAAQEAERAVERLGLLGISLGANRGMRLDHRSVWPVFEFAAAAGVPVYLPASYTPGAGASPYRALGSSGVISGAASDSGQHALQLMFGGVFDAFPRLQVVLSRMGEGTPYWVGRLEETYQSVRESGGALPKQSVKNYFSNNILLTTADMAAETVHYCSTILGNGRVIVAHGSSGASLATEGANLAMLGRLTAVEPWVPVGRA